MNTLRLAWIAVVLAAVPTMSACGSDRGSTPCSSADKRQLQARMSGVEARAQVSLLSASGPSCGSYDAPTLSAVRTYPFATGVQAAITAALSENGWTSTRAPDGTVYTAQIKNGRFMTYVELSTRPNDEPGGSVLQATYETRKP